MINDITMTESAANAVLAGQLPQQEALPGLRHDWQRQEILALFTLPFSELLYRAQSVHRQYFDPTRVQVSSLLSIKTGACPEDCAYCPQSVHHEVRDEREALMPLDQVLDAARRARDSGATRFCMGAAWRAPRDKDLESVAAMIGGIRALGMESCVTLGMLSEAQAQRLADAGLDYYNHNLDSSPEFYGQIISTRTYRDRLDTLEHVREAGINVCAGGIIGMGEDESDRAGLLQQLANLPRHPESVPINLLVRVEGTPLADPALNLKPPHILDFVRTIAVARLTMPASTVRLSAGRESMSDEAQALCFAAGANSVFYGERLLTTDNPMPADDLALFERLGMKTTGAGHDA